MGEGGSGGVVFDFLGAHVVGVTTLVAAVDSTGWQVSITLHHLIAVIFLGELAVARVDDAVS